MIITDILSNKKHVKFFSKNNDGSSSSLQIKSGEGKVRKNTKFRYFRLTVYGKSMIQFCSLQFYKTQDDIFSYCKGLTPTVDIITQYVSYSHTGTCKTGDDEGMETPVNGLLPVYYSEGELTCDKKCCVSISDPVIIQYDLLSSRLDVSKYSKWRIYTANDTSGYSSRNLFKFTVQVSNTPEVESSWITIVNNYTNPQNPITSQNYSIMFDFDLDLTQILN